LEHERDVAVLKGKSVNLQATQDKAVEKALLDTQTRVTVAEEER
jgi:hypothetical protein